MSYKLAVLVIAATFPVAAGAQVARMEIVSFPSLTMTDGAFLAGSKEGKPVMLAGSLRLPKPSGRLPAVVLVHGSGGISGYVTDWEQDLNAIGVATFVVDSWSGRGVTSVVLDQSQVPRLAQIYDSFRALEALEKHPRIDPARIAVMGFSRGGQGALYTGLKRFQKMHGPASGNEYAAYIALYPTCVPFRDDEVFSAKPVRIFHGGADNYVPVKWCRSYAARLKAKGADIEHNEYAGAHHVYDWASLRTPNIIEKGQTARNCELKENDQGRIVNAKSGADFSYADPCVEVGVTVAYDEAASNETRKAVKQLVTAVLKP